MLWTMRAAPAQFYFYGYASWHYLASFGCPQFTHRILGQRGMTARLASSIIGNRRFGAPIEPSISFIESYGLTDIYVYSYSYGGLLAVSPESRALRSWASSGEPENHAPYGFVGFLRWALNHALYGYGLLAMSPESCALRNHGRNGCLQKGLVLKWLLSTVFVVNLSPPLS